MNKTISSFKNLNNVYRECLSIIRSSNDKNILNKKLRLNNEFIKYINDPNEEYKFYSIVDELRFYDFLTKHGFTISASNDNKGGPDYYCSQIGYIECVSATKGNLGTPEREWIETALLEKHCRYKSLIPRISAAINSKRDKYDNYINNGIIDVTEPKIIEVSISMLSDEVRSELLEKSTQQILYGMGTQCMLYNKQTGFVSDNIEWRDYNKMVKKYNKSFPTDYFHDPKYNIISAVILTSNAFTEQLIDDKVFVFLNPNADIPINIDALTNLNYFYRINTNDHYEDYAWHNA